MLREWFDNATYLAHGYCLYWKPWLVASQAISDLLIADAYFAIPVAIVIYLRRRGDVELWYLAVLFAAFILLCGMTHLIQTITLWWPIYETQVAVKIVCAAVSLATAAVVFPLIPKALAIPSPRELQAVNEGLAAEVDAHRRTLSQLEKARDELERRVAERTEELGALTEHLEERVAAEVAKNREKDHMMIQQSRLASMGEMVQNIAHQWRQPLNSLGLLVSNVLDDVREDRATPEMLEADAVKARQLIAGMSKTLDEFRDFFVPSKEMSAFDAAESIRSAVGIIDAALRHHKVELECDLAEELRILGEPNVFAQAVLNVIVNAKEAIIGRHVENGRIRLTLVRRGEAAELTIEDNAGGIDESVLPRVFDPYFTTKRRGSGIGLYMAKMIVATTMGGAIEVANAESGARFVITVPLTTAGPPEEGAQAAADKPVDR